MWLARDEWMGNNENCSKLKCNSKTLDKRRGRRGKNSKNFRIQNPTSTAFMAGTDFDIAKKMRERESEKKEERGREKTTKEQHSKSI